MGADKNQNIRVNKVAGEAIKTLIEFCMNEKIVNPKITMDAKISDNERYRLIFERLDLDDAEKTLWEYKRHEIAFGSYTPSQLFELINNYAKQGWELYYYDEGKREQGDYRFTFVIKRKL